MRGIDPVSVSISLPNRPSLGGSLQISHLNHIKDECLVLIRAVAILAPTADDRLAMRESTTAPRMFVDDPEQRDSDAAKYIRPLIDTCPNPPDPEGGTRLRLVVSNEPAQEAA